MKKACENTPHLLKRALKYAACLQHTHAFAAYMLQNGENKMQKLFNRLMFLTIYRIIFGML